MDDTKETYQEASQQLIDIFYKDTYRIDSLISQINNGALQTVTTKTDKTQGSTTFSAGSVRTEINLFLFLATHKNRNNPIFILSNT